MSDIATMLFNTNCSCSASCASVVEASMARARSAISRYGSGLNRGHINRRENNVISCKTGRIGLATRTATASGGAKKPAASRPDSTASVLGSISLNRISVSSDAAAKRKGNALPAALALSSRKLMIDATAKYVMLIIRFQNSTADSSRSESSSSAAASRCARVPAASRSRSG
jgi:hypothetical protein